MKQGTRLRGQSAIEYLFVMVGALIFMVLVLGILITITQPNFNWVYQQGEKTTNEQICDQLGSNSFARCIVSDKIPPGDILSFNLSYNPSAPRTIFLSWNWPADDGLTQSGNVNGVQIVYVHDSLTNGLGATALQDQNNFSNWLNAPTPLNGSISAAGTFNASIPAPQTPGTFSVVQVNFPAGYTGTYYFGIRAFDDSNQFSGIAVNTYTV